MFSNGILAELFSDPRATLMFLLLALPGRLLAISAHEAAHGWVADRCGDPTARMLGRVTLNPIKHLDPVGVFCMLVFGIGWAKPVPVNPRNFRGNYRKCDLLVSIAGIAMNLLMFVVGCVAMYIFIAVALAAIPYENAYTGAYDVVRTVYEGVPAVISGDYWIGMTDLMCAGIALDDFLITPVFGQTVGYIYQMLAYFVTTNLVLAVFNLIPVPPLDGYHVLNDLILKGRLYASEKVARIGQAALYIALFSGVLSDALGWVYDLALDGVGVLAALIFRAFGVF